ncbi:MAG: hypothetical protein EOO24_42250 [Comamonadaceae bacterium]|nr:MAG: hypothetical protein EOO24_42250 [Comamonadaceae bacterium]
MQLTSPTGRYLIQVVAREMRMSHWVEAPELVDTVRGETLLCLQSGLWSLEAATWEGDTSVRMRLRRYPGASPHAQVDLRVDCAAGTASVQEGGACRLADVEATLESILERRGNA